MPRSSRVLLVLALAVSTSSSRASADEPAFVPVDASGTARFTPAPRENDLPECYRQEACEFPFETEFERFSGPVRIFKVRFPSPVTTDVPENNTVHGHYFQPEGEGPFPGVVVLHILGGEFALSQMVANSLARKKVAALFIKMPYYGERRSKDSPRRMFSRAPAETVEGFTQAVLDIRRGAAWLASRPEVDPERLGVTGISLGGVMSALSAAAEPRFRKVAIILGGGRIPEALWNLDHRDAEEFRRQWIADGGTRESFLEQMEPIDPANFGHLLTDRTVLMVAGRHDEVIPPKCTVALWESIGRKPELVWLDAGHYSAIAYLYGEMERLGAFFTADAPPSRSGSSPSP